MKTVVTLIPMLPLLGFVVTLLFGRAFGKSAHIFAVAMVTAAWALAMYVVWHVFGHQEDPIQVHLFTWIKSGSFDLGWGYYVDTLTAIMLIVVGTIGMLVHYYSIGYMHGDGGYYRFFAYLNLFMFAMYTLILGDSYLLMFLGWEGVGLCSYLLISFWFHKKSASQAGKKAFLVNRVGDFGFLLAMFLIFLSTGTLQFTGVFAQAGEIAGGTVLAITLLLFMGACGKSAQFPLHIWLPDAMEGPTPVSALIHAATMVNAGVYMVARSYPLFMNAHTAMIVVMVIGSFTAIYSALIALTQHDIKRVIAYSTLSSLGFMFMALGAGAWAAGMFYLLVHGFFKGLLFLASGSVIHAMSGEQDMRQMGGLRKQLPLTFWTMVTGAVAMAGVFPLAGFWAKDEIIGAAFNEGYYTVWVVGIITAFVTAVYMGRLIFLTFWGECRASDEVKQHIHESPAVMTVPLVILAVPAAVLGMVVGLPPDEGWIHRFLEPVFTRVEAGAAEGAVAETFSWFGRGGLLMVVSLAVVLAGVYLAYRMYVRSRDLPAKVVAVAPWAYKWSLNKFYMDEFYEVAAIRSTISFSRMLWTFADVKIIDGAVNGLAWAWDRLSVRLRPLQTGRAQDYALGVFSGMFVLIIVMHWVWRP